MKTNWIREKREELKISQFKMAKAIKVPSYILSDWERGHSKPTNMQAILIKNFFKDYTSFFKKENISISKKRFERSPKRVKSLNNSKQRLEIFYQRNKKIKYETDPKLNAIMLFSGIGGLSLGFEMAGYNIIGHVEIVKAFNDIYRLNFPNSDYFGGDIRNITNEQILALKKKYKEIAVIAGGPPCQGFSLAGKRNVFDPRNELFKDFARFASIMQPKAILLENVRTLLTMESKDGSLVKEYVLESFDKAGYDLICNPINAMDYGIPQSRGRVIFIGLRKDISANKKLLFPKPICGQGLTKEYKTFRDATKDLELLESGEVSENDPWHFAIVHPPHIIRMLKGVPEGKSAHENSDPKLRPSSGYNTTYKRIKWDEPCSTISTNFSMISGSRNVHPINTRSLTIREAMRCQTFPDSFLLQGSLGSIRAGIGNAVPPLLAKYFANWLKNLITD
jgi:DNA (cytosine-5)-methyltransferase 1